MKRVYLTILCVFVTGFFASYFPTIEVENGLRSQFGHTLDEEIHVLADIFSGRPNPTWVLRSGTDTLAFAQLFQECNEKLMRQKPSTGLGYRGFVVYSSDAPEERVYIHNCPVLENFLVETAVALGVAGKHGGQNLTEALFQGIANAQALRGRRTRAAGTDAGDWRSVADAVLKFERKRQDFLEGAPLSAIDSCTELRSLFINMGYKPLAAKDENERPVRRRRSLIALGLWRGVDVAVYRKTEGQKFWTVMGGDGRQNSLDNAGHPIRDPSKAARGPFSSFCGRFYLDR